MSDLDNQDEVWIVNLGASVSRSQAGRYPMPAYLYGAVRSARAYGANLRWAGPGTLTVEYLTARNVTQDVSEVWVGNQAVRVILRSGVDDPSAPPGGMLHNRELAARAGDQGSAPGPPARG